jgi:hypothetical protein
VIFFFFSFTINSTGGAGTILTKRLHLSIIHGWERSIVQDTLCTHMCSNICINTFFHPSKFEFKIKISKLKKWKYHFVFSSFPYPCDLSAGIARKLFSSFSRPSDLSAGITINLSAGIVRKGFSSFPRSSDYRQESLREGGRCTMVPPVASPVATLQGRIRFAFAFPLQSRRLGTVFGWMYFWLMLMLICCYKKILFYK